MMQSIDYIRTGLPYFLENSPLFFGFSPPLPALDLESIEA